MKYSVIYGPDWIHSLSPEMKNNLLSGKSIIIGNKIYQVCHDCRTVVQVNKTFFGSTHFC